LVEQNHIRGEREREREICNYLEMQALCSKVQ
jgi:hypothetical protein